MIPVLMTAKKATTYLKTALTVLTVAVTVVSIADRMLDQKNESFSDVLNEIATKLLGD